MLVPGMYLADRYEILEKIGSGGMADVYKAKCHKLNRLVAIKVLKPEFSSDVTFVKKFRVEAQSAAGLSHPNIVNVYDVGEESGIYFIVMELVQGITLKSYIEMKGKLEIREALNISIQIASGLSAAHQNRIIHRDIKPQNIIMSRDGKVKVTDFGIAKVADSTTVTTAAAGSVHYISPEQARGGYSDAKSDIYSLGITMYEMLTGKVPFDGETNVAVAMMHIQSEIIPPRRLDPSIPRSFEKIILKCTQKKPDRRYASAKELIADLRRVLSNPDGEYVKLNSSIADSTTVVMSDEELDAVKRQRSAAVQNQRRQTEAQARQNQQNRRPSGQSYVPDDDDEDDDDGEVNPKLEKVMMVLGIVGAIILVIVVCFIIGKAAGLFGGAGNSESATDSRIESMSETDDTKAATVEVPDVTDMTQDKAITTLAESELKFKIVEENNDDVDEGKVIRQDPQKGTEVEKNFVVTLYVSKGKEAFEMGDYSGLTLGQAQNKLSADGLVQKTIEYEYSDTVDKDLVTRTDPTKGSSVSKGDAVTIYISKGEEIEKTTVPALVGQDKSSALAAIRNAGLVEGNVSQDYSDEYRAGLVISFTVDGRRVSEGSQVDKGATVSIVVSAGQKPPENITMRYSMENPYGGAETGGYVKVVQKSTGAVLFEQQVEPNTQIAFDITGQPGTTVALDLYQDNVFINTVYATISSNAG